MTRYFLPQTFAAFMVAWAGAAQSQSFHVSTGGKGQTYSKMFQELSVQCESDVGSKFISVESSGATENLDRLLNNEVTAAMVQIDVLHLRSKVSDLSHVKALFALHPEEVHIVVQSSPKTEGGYFGTSFGAKTVTLTSLENLSGRVVGAWGGGLVTAQVIRSRSGIDFKVKEFGSQLEAQKALDDGSIDALVAVGGAPLNWVQSLSRRYKLLEISDAEAAKLKTVYRPARVTYTNLGQMGIPTIATEATLVTRDYKTPALNEMLTKVRHCFQTRLTELQEKVGNHAKWQAVKANFEPRWPMYQVLPVKAAPMPQK